MSLMFEKASSFNQPIGTWNVSNVTYMERMFSRASVFNQDISQWNMSSVTDMNRMFRGASLFNQPIGQWNVVGVRVNDMENMFRGASSFNQDVSHWNASRSRVIDFSELGLSNTFEECVNVKESTSTQQMNDIIKELGITHNDIKNELVTLFTGQDNNRDTLQSKLKTKIDHNIVPGFNDDGDDTDED